MAITLGVIGATGAFLVASKLVTQRADARIRDAAREKARAPTPTATPPTLDDARAGRARRRGSRFPARRRCAWPRLAPRPCSSVCAWTVAAREMCARAVVDADGAGRRRGLAGRARETARSARRKRDAAARPTRRAHRSGRARAAAAWSARRARDDGDDAEAARARVALAAAVTRHARAAASLEAGERLYTERATRAGLREAARAADAAEARHAAARELADEARRCRQAIERLEVAMLSAGVASARAPRAPAGERGVRGGLPSPRALRECRNAGDVEPITLEPLASYAPSALVVLPSGNCMAREHLRRLQRRADPFTNLQLPPEEAAPAASDSTARDLGEVVRKRAVVVPEATDGTHIVSMSRVGRRAARPQ